jgi:hypothetical protein
MGYELHITRKVKRFDEDLQFDITLEEWKMYVNSDKELRLLIILRKQQLQTDKF